MFLILTLKQLAWYLNLTASFAKNFYLVGGGQNYEISGILWK